MFLEISQISQENICCQTYACNFIKKETLAQVFSCEIREIYKNTFFIEHLWWLLLDFISKIEGWCHTEFFDLITSNYRQIYLHNFCVLCNYRDIHTQKQLEIWTQKDNHKHIFLDVVTFWEVWIGSITSSFNFACKTLISLRALCSLTRLANFTT